MPEQKPEFDSTILEAQAVLARCRRTLQEAGHTLNRSHAALSADRTLPPLVLVVDRLDDDREFFTRWLAIQGFRVATAASGTEALDMVLQTDPAAVLLDLVLPDFDGLDVARTLRDDAETAGIPIIAISAALPTHNEEVAVNAGCRAFVAKPCPPEEVLLLLRAVLARAS
jgi:CheY-like chemotaxis protein